MRRRSTIGSRSSASTPSSRRWPGTRGRSSREPRAGRRSCEVLTGYVDDEISLRPAAASPLAERDRDVVYRATQLPSGSAATASLKHEIGGPRSPPRKARAPRRHLDRPRDAILGARWLDFLASGVRSSAPRVARASSTAGRGAPAIRFRGPPGRSRGPAARGWDGQRFIALSPRHLEAALTGTAQILVAGDYSGVLEPGRHYLPIRADLADLETRWPRRASRGTPEAGRHRLRRALRERALLVARVRRPGGRRPPRARRGRRRRIEAAEPASSAGRQPRRESSSARAIAAVGILRARRARVGSPAVATILRRHVRHRRRRLPRRAPVPQLRPGSDAMNELIAHRGPDGEAIWMHRDEHVGFAHRRLAIIDLETGRPADDATSAGNWITYNGEIYNYLELRDGARRATGSAPRSDTEVILRAYRELGRGLPRAAARHVRLRALGRGGRARSSARATASASSRSTTRSSTASSTSPPRSRRCCRSCRRSRPTSRAFKDYLTFQFCLGGKTLFKGVQELLPGHFLRVRNGHGRDAALLGGLLRARLRPHGRVLRGAARGAAATTRSRSTCARTCRSARTSAAASTRASSPSLAAASTPAQLLGFTGKFRRRRGYDESRVRARRSPTQRGLRAARARHHAPTTSSSTSGDVIYHLDYPVAGPGSFPQYMVSELAAQAPQGRARRPGRRRDLRRLRALPDRLLRAVHQGGDRRHDATAATSSSPTSRSSRTWPRCGSTSRCCRSSGATASSTTSTRATSA